MSLIYEDDEKKNVCYALRLWDELMIWINDMDYYEIKYTDLSVTFREQLL